ncbi:MAG: hypothetical protein HAW66_05420 [Shewanella sp.]|nr:hypothetical protein [Shewanella sp.]
MVAPTGYSTSPSRYDGKHLDDTMMEQSEEKKKLDKEGGGPRYMEQPSDNPPAYAPTAAPRTSHTSTNGGVDRPLHPEHQAGADIRNQGEVQGSSRPRSNQGELSRGRIRKPKLSGSNQAHKPVVVPNTKTQEFQKAAKQELHESTIEKHTNDFVETICKRCPVPNSEGQLQWAKLIPYVKQQTLLMIGNDEIRDDDMSAVQKHHKFKQDFVNASKQGSFDLIFFSMVNVLKEHAGLSNKLASECLMKCIQSVLLTAEDSNQKLTADDQYILSKLNHTLNEVSYACDKTIRLEVTEKEVSTLITELSLHANRIQPEVTSTIEIGDIAFHIFKAINGGNEDAAGESVEKFEKFYESAALIVSEPSNMGELSPEFDTSGNLSFMINCLSKYLSNGKICDGIDNAKATIYFYLAQLAFKDSNNKEGDPSIKPQMKDIFQGGLMQCSHESEQQTMQYALMEIMECDFATPAVTQSPYFNSQRRPTLTPMANRALHQNLTPQAMSGVKGNNALEDFSYSLRRNLPVGQPPSVTNKTMPMVKSGIDSTEATISRLCVSHGVDPESLDNNIEDGWSRLTYQLAQKIGSFALLGNELVAQEYIFQVEYSGIFVNPNYDETGKVDRLLNTLINRNPFNNHRFLISTLVKLGKVSEASGIINVLKNNGRLTSLIQDPTLKSTRPDRDVPIPTAIKYEIYDTPKTGHKRLVNQFMVENFADMIGLVKGELLTFAGKLKASHIIGGGVHSKATFEMQPADTRASALLSELGNQVSLQGPALFFRILHCLENDARYARAFCKLAREQLSVAGVREENYPN